MSFTDPLTMILRAETRRGSRPALDAHTEGALSSAWLELRAGQWGATLASEGVGRGARVGLRIEKSAELVAAMLGCWWVGAAFTPIPLEDDTHTAQLLSAANPTLCIHRGDLDEAAPGVARADLGPDDVAYVMCTSGSSGTPRAVVVTHRGIPTLWRAQIDAFGIVPGHRSLWYLHEGFDASISDLGCALASGATLVIRATEELQNDLMGALSRHRITHADLPPRLLGVHAPEDAPDCLTTIIVGGEAAPIEPAKAWAKTRTLLSVYGPTEATVCTHIATVTPGDWEAAYLGSPIEGVVERIVDGELWVGGPCVAAGYLGDAESTASRFVEDGGERFYRTGDRAEQDARGRLVFMGRADRQIQRFGRRVELDDIALCVAQALGISDVAVTWRDPILTAHVTGHVPNDWRDLLAASMPSWKIPNRVVSRDDLDRTPRSGKTDHAALTKRDDTEALRLLWARALDLPRAHIAPASDLVSLGADSMMLLEVCSSARATLGLELTPSQWLAHRTIARVLAHHDEPTQRLGIDALRERTRELDATVPRATPSLHASPAARERVLVTGATGMLGAALVLEWCARQDPRDLAVLIRPRRGGAPRAALAEACARAGEVVSDGVLGGITILVGDITQPMLGLEPEAYARWAAELSGVVHAAALVHAHSGFDELADSNVVGTARVARFANTGRPKRAVLCSSLAIGASSDRAQRWRAHDADDFSWLDGGYAQSKWGAEWVWRGRIPPERRCIARMSLLEPTRANLSATPRADAWSHWARSAQVAGRDGPEDRWMNAVPVEDVARELLALYAQDELPERVVYAAARATPCADPTGMASTAYPVDGGSM